ncbi:MAG: rhomboid family intramembrane serine protease [Armatimonadota bacterium]
MCLLLSSGLISLIFVRSVRVESQSTIWWYLISPVVHADYLHMCVNLLGGLLVLSRVEEKSGWRQTLFVVCLSYGLHVVSVALITFVFAKPIEVVGLSSAVYAAIGFFFKENYPYFSAKEKSSIIPFLVLMLVIDVELRSIIVHLVAFAFGLAVSSAMSRRHSNS